MLFATWTNPPGGIALEVKADSFNRVRVSKVEQMEAELRKLSQAELCQIREWLDDLIEDELEFTPEFERSVQQAERDMADEKSARVRERTRLRSTLCRAVEVCGHTRRSCRASRSNGTLREQPR